MSSWLNQHIIRETFSDPQAWLESPTVHSYGAKDISFLTLITVV